MCYSTSLTIPSAREQPATFTPGPLLFAPALAPSRIAQQSVKSSLAPLIDWWTLHIEPAVGESVLHHYGLCPTVSNRQSHDRPSMTQCPRLFAARCTLAIFALPPVVMNGNDTSASESQKRYVAISFVNNELELTPHRAIQQCSVCAPLPHAASDSVALYGTGPRRQRGDR